MSKPTVLELYKIQQGDVTAYAIGRESAREAAQAMESADEWGGIPFVTDVVCDDSEALSLLCKSSLENALKLARFT